MTWLLAAILEGLNILDIVTTEVGLKREHTERNPFWRKDKYRRLMYPFKLSFPIILEAAGQEAERTGYPFWRKFVWGCEIGLIGFSSVITINNLWVILSKERK